MPAARRMILDGDRGEGLAVRLDAPREMQMPLISLAPFKATASSRKGIDAPI